MQRFSFLRLLSQPPTPLSIHHPSQPFQRGCSTHVEIEKPLPYIFRRTKSNNLPVYLDYKNGRTKVVTVLRNYRGDITEILSELNEILPDADFEEKVGRIEVKGNHKATLQKWLQRRGF